MHFSVKMSQLGLTFLTFTLGSLIGCRGPRTLGNTVCLDCKYKNKQQAVGSRQQAVGRELHDESRLLPCAALRLHISITGDLIHLNRPQGQEAVRDYH